MELGPFGDFFDLVSKHKEVTGSLGLPEAVCKYLYL